MAPLAPHSVTVSGPGHTQVTCRSPGWGPRCMLSFPCWLPSCKNHTTWRPASPLCPHRAGPGSVGLWIREPAGAAGSLANSMRVPLPGAWRGGSALRMAGQGSFPSSQQEKQVSASPKGSRVPVRLARLSWEPMGLEPWDPGHKGSALGFLLVTPRQSLYLVAAWSFHS